MLLDDISLGATADLQSATAIARELVEVHGLAGGRYGLTQFLDLQTGKRRDQLSSDTLTALDARVAEIIEEQRRRAEGIVRENRPLIELLRDTLLEKKTLDSKALASLIPKPVGDANRAKKAGAEAGSATV